MTSLTDGVEPRSSNAAAIAAALWDSADFDAAAHYYERALSENAQDAEALHGLGRLKLAHNDLPGATLLLEEAFRLAGEGANARQQELARRIRYDLAWSLYRLDRFDLAAGHFARLEGYEPIAAQLRAIGERTPYRIAVDVEDIEVPFLGTDPLPVIGLTIGNTEYPFVLDTGSAQIVLDQGLAAGMDLPRLGTREAIFASGTRAPISYSVLPSLIIGETTIRDVPVEVMEVRRFAPQIYGFIGTHFLQRFTVLCDWEGETLFLRRTRAPTFDAFTEMVEAPFWLLDSHLMLAPATLDGYETIAYLASGMAGAAFTIPDSTRVQAGLDFVGDAVAGVGVGGGTAELETVFAQHLCLGAWCRSEMNGLVGFFPSELEWRYGFRVGALVSQEFLKGRRWGIDFERMRLYFD